MGNDADQIVLLIFGILLILAGIVSLVRLAGSLIRKDTTRLVNIMSAVAGVALILGGGACLATKFINEGKAASFEASLIKQAEETNRNLPRMIDENTRYDEATVVGTEIYYRNTVVNSTADEVDKALFQKIMYQKLTNHLCPNRDITALLRKGVKYHYNYFGKEGGLISSVVISRETCGIR